MKLNKRLIVKGIGWELTGLIYVYLLLSLFDFTPGKTSIIWLVGRLAMYYSYHLLWKKIKWGK